jgi:para-nitrobenzyl esterase
MKTRILSVLGLLMLCGAFNAWILAPTAVAAPAIVTQSGPLKGIETPTMNEYLGIPYAVPPVGSLRWMPPIRHPRWHGVFQATEFGNMCTQPDGLGGVIGSEDCLTLNVYTPPAKKNQNKHHGLPVMVWIHGGALTIGSGVPYDPTPLVEQGLIVVTINYRLGYLGFFAHPAIDAEGHLNGNYGLMDQQLALKWVQRNIRAFGGDPHRVTIFGESAGGQSVYANLASPTAAGLFSGAIAESGAYLEFQDYYDYIVTLAIGETTGTLGVPSGNAIATSVGCGSDATAACLRAVPASTLVEAEPSTIFPFVDGTVLTQTPSAAFASGQFNQVPVISGGNHDEWRLFVADEYDFLGTPLTDAEYATAVDALWGSALEGYVLYFYPLPPSPPADAASLALGASGTDGIFACPERNSVQLLSKYVTTYAYEFNDENAPPPQSAFGGLLTFPLGAYHTAELQYLFVDADFFGLPLWPLSSDQQQLSDAMVGYWTQFAKTGDPNSPSEPVWSPYNASTDNFQSLIPPTPTVESTFDSNHLCSKFWNMF